MLRHTKTDDETRKASTSDVATAGATAAANAVPGEQREDDGVISMHDQPMPKEVEAARARRKGQFAE